MAPPERSRPWEQALAAAERAALEAGALLRSDFHRQGGARGELDKADADVEAERLIRGRLRAEFPGWGYLGEETGRSAGSPGSPVWLVDPNDGTRDYLEGRRGSSVSIGLVHEGRPVLGVVHPFCYPDDAGSLYSWAEGLGPVRRDGQPQPARPPQSLTPRAVVLVSSKGDRAPEANLRCAAPARFRAVPSIAHRLALVAAGEADAATSVFAPVAWDYGAGHALLRGSGGVLLDETGREVGYAADGESHAQCAYAGSLAVAAELARRPWAGLLEVPRTWAGAAALRKGRALADAGVLSRVHGCLLGQVAGDSLGSLVEFEDGATVRARYPDGPRELEDGGVWGTLAGQPTDDSEMALALARAIVAREGYEDAAAAEAYRAWLGSGPFDVGRTTRAALEGRPLAGSQANGSLMRASPLAILAHRSAPEEAAELGRRDSRLTHPHPTCCDAVAAFVVAAAAGIRGGEGPEAAYAAALGWAKTAAAAPVVEALEAAASGPPECDGASPGWVLVALRNAFHELVRAESLEQAVVDTVRRGGDTDTNAAIAGALLGAVHGREAVPAQWRRMVLSCRAAAGARRPRPPEYWPSDVLELAERVALCHG